MSKGSLMCLDLKGVRGDIYVMGEVVDPRLFIFDD